MKIKVCSLITLPILILCGAFFTGACTGPLISESTGEIAPEIDNRRRTGECSYSEHCQEICDEIFEDGEKQEHCEQFSVEDVEKLKVVFRILKDFNINNSSSVDQEDLEFLLNISPKPLETIVEQMNENQQNDFLVLIANDAKTAAIVGSAETEEFEILKRLLGSGENQILSVINKPIDREDTVIEIALKKNNETLLGWFHDFFGSQCEKNFSFELCVFTRYYCSFSLSEESVEKDFFKYPHFTKMLNNILRNHRPGRSPQWWTRSITTQNLKSWQNFPHKVCLEDLYYH
ncbi:MAG: hypothetical protein OXB86_01600 [Bdellovibrionales bacterium]|nr:hypothetical protein [Bdellovibrionales bacterium]